jgi:hypothetical protein
MTEEELRALVRQAIATVQSGRSVASGLSHPSHPSHLTFMVPSGSDQDGPCIIEPAVMCNHCGYCKSLGH